MMRKGCLLLLALTGPGCLSWGSHVEAESRQAPLVQMVNVPPPPPVVTADQITEDNAPDKAQALARELDYEDNPPRPSAPAPAEADANNAATMKP